MLTVLAGWSRRLQSAGLLPDSLMLSMKVTRMLVLQCASSAAACRGGRPSARSAALREPCTGRGICAACARCGGRRCRPGRQPSGCPERRRHQRNGAAALRWRRCRRGGRRGLRGRGCWRGCGRGCPGAGGRRGRCGTWERGCGAGWRGKRGTCAASCPRHSCACLRPRGADPGACASGAPTKPGPVRSAGSGGAHHRARAAGCERPAVRACALGMPRVHGRRGSGCT